MKEYRNISNTSRASSVERKDFIGESGEVFTPDQAVDSVLQTPEVLQIILDDSRRVLDPAAGDGDFLEKIVGIRIADKEGVEDTLEALRHVWSVEIKEDNVRLCRETIVSQIVTHAPPQTMEELDMVVEWEKMHILRGNYLSETGCFLKCPEGCSNHEPLDLPVHFDLVVGNPPFNPGTVYKDFVLKALKKSDLVSFILPDYSDRVFMGF